MKDTIKTFTEEYIHQNDMEYIYVKTDDGDQIKGKPINPADDLILYAKMFLDHSIDTSNITIDDIRNELLDQKLIFKSGNMYLTTKRVMTTKLLNFISKTNNNKVTNNEIMKAIKMLPNVISMNTENSIRKMSDHTVNMIDEVYEKNNSDFKTSMRSEHTDFMHKFSVALFDMIETMKPSELQKGEDNYSLPDEIKKIVSECLLNAQQQNEESVEPAMEIINQREDKELSEVQ